MLPVFASTPSDRAPSRTTRGALWGSVVLCVGLALVGCPRPGLERDDAGEPMDMPSQDASATNDAAPDPVPDAGSPDPDPVDSGSPGEADSSTDPDPEPDPDAGNGDPDPLAPSPDNSSDCPNKAPQSSIAPCAEFTYNLDCKYGQDYTCTCKFPVWICGN